MNTTNTLVSSTIVNAPAMDDFNTMQTLALVAYAPEQTDVYKALLTNVFLLKANMFVYLIYAQFMNMLNTKFMYLLCHVPSTRPS